MNKVVSIHRDRSVGFDDLAFGRRALRQVDATAGALPPPRYKGTDGEPLYSAGEVAANAGAFMGGLSEAGAKKESALGHMSDVINGQLNELRSQIASIRQTIPTAPAGPATEHHFDEDAA